MNYIRSLESFGTRFMISEKRFEAAAWIKEQFESMGFTEVELDTFECKTNNFYYPDINMRIDTTTIQVNVVATLRGSETPDDYYVIGGHYDDFCENDDIMVTAPGADDNASGTTCVLESARAIMSTGYQPKSTLVFVAFAAEELGARGLMGSDHYAQEAAARGDNIRLVINNDMIGFNAQPITQAKINVAPNSVFTRIEDVIDVCHQYGNITYLPEGYSGADLRTFTQMGYPGIYFEENDFAIQYFLNYHKNTDISSNIDSLFITEAIKGATAVLLSMEDVLSDNEAVESLPVDYQLNQNFPNPFNPSTVIEYSVPHMSKVTLKVYNLLGEVIKELVDEVKGAGKYRSVFNASDLSSGIYFYTLKAENFIQTKKMILLK